MMETPESLPTQASRTPGRGSEYVVGLLDSFKHVGPNGTHVCMVFEPMGYNLLSLIKFYDYRGIPIDIVRQISRQVTLFVCAMCRIYLRDFDLAGADGFGFPPYQVQYYSY